ncbi:uncharacterized protein PG986_007338 [Apiospora aurea]|uniref:Cell division control protein 14 n=1 Tax=Apiospora aurea TaxID=335848 RepID=A0ABR1QC98_9PEZI
MENLLSLAFDNLSSYDGPKIRKGLRQVEGLMANICLPKKQKTHHGKKEDSNSTEDDSDNARAARAPKSLAGLTEDPVFHEFFKLQEGFEWNLAHRLVTTLDRLIAKGGDGQNDLLILSALDLLQGVSLLHPPSRKIFGRESNMNLLLDLLEPDFCPAIQSSTMRVLNIALVDNPQNTRTYENLDGLLTVTSLFKSRGTNKEVKYRCMEFLYFYLMPETPSIPSVANARESVPALLQRSPSKLAKAFQISTDGEGGARVRSDSDAAGIRTQAEKQAILCRYLGNIDDLLGDLQKSAVFGGALS